MDRLLKRRIRTVCEQGFLDGVDKKIWFKLLVDGGVLFDMRTPQSLKTTAYDTQDTFPGSYLKLKDGRDRQLNGQIWTR